MSSQYFKSFAALTYSFLSLIHLSAQLFVTHTLSDIKIYSESSFHSSISFINQALFVQNMWKRSQLLSLTQAHRLSAGPTVYRATGKVGYPAANTIGLGNVISSNAIY